MARLWTRDGELVQVFRGHTDSVTEAAFVAGGERIATVSNRPGDHRRRHGHLTALIRTPRFHGKP
jgi:hypothetical protein